MGFLWLLKIQDLPEIPCIIPRRLRNLEVNSLKRFVGLTAAESWAWQTFCTDQMTYNPQPPLETLFSREFRDRAETDREDLCRPQYMMRGASLGSASAAFCSFSVCILMLRGFHSELEGYREGPGSFGTGRFCIGDPPILLATHRKGLNMAISTEPT